MTYVRLIDGSLPNVTARAHPFSLQATYDSIDFNLDDYKEDAGVSKVGKGELLHNNKADILMARWRYPTLSLHGIEGAFADPGAKTVIPRKVIGKFSLRLVPDQSPAQIARVVEGHLNKEFDKLNSPNHMWVRPHHGAKVSNASFQAFKLCLHTAGRLLTRHFYVPKQRLGFLAPITRTTMPPQKQWSKYLARNRTLQERVVPSLSLLGSKMLLK